jgi:CheY-like chemotaxis protein
MPRVNGIELAQIIKGTKRFRQIPILFLTAHMIDDQDAIAGYGAGAVDYPRHPAACRLVRRRPPRDGRRRGLSAGPPARARISPLMVALTGWGKDEDRKRTKDAGFDHHLVKPVALDVLAEVLRRADREDDPLRS